MRTAVYHRVSTTEQNPDAARAELGDYVRARKWELVLDVVETGSGARSDRPGLHQVLEAVRRRRVDAVVVWKLDRVGRSVIDLLGFMRTLDAAGVRLVCMTQQIDTHDAMGRFAFTILAAAAELELEHLRERTRAGLAHARKRGRKLGPPKRHQLDPHQVAQLRAQVPRPSWAAIGQHLGCSGPTAYRAFQSLSQTEGANPPPPPSDAPTDHKRTFTKGATDGNHATE